MLNKLVTHVLKFICRKNVSEEQLQAWVNEEVDKLAHKESRKPAKVSVGIYIISPNNKEVIYQFLLNDLGKQKFALPLKSSEFKLVIRIADYEFFKEQVGLDFLDKAISKLEFTDIYSAAEKANDPYKIFHPQAQKFFLLIPSEMLYLHKKYLLKKIGSMWSIMLI